MFIIWTAALRTKVIFATMNGTTAASEDDDAVGGTQKKVMKKIKNRKEKVGNDVGNTVCRPFSPKSEKYIRKMERLVRIYERISEVCFIS